jgi:hypothetical protein
MDRMRRYILESAFPADFAKAVYNALGIFEAVNINKDFLIRKPVHRNGSQRPRVPFRLCGRLITWIPSLIRSLHRKC